jgi:hypothetical protein
MPDIPILGQTPTTPLHTDDLTDAQRAALAQMAEDNPPGEDEIDGGLKVTTAFLVIVSDDGAVIADSNIAKANELLLQRGATTDDIYGASAVVQKDLAAMETAQRTQQTMMMMGQAMQRQAEEARIRSSLNLG